MCITQLLKPLSFSSPLAILDSLLFAGNYRLMGALRGLDRGKPETMLRWRLALSWEAGQLAGNDLRKKGIQEPQSCCDTDVLPQILLNCFFSFCVLHFPCPYPITVSLFSFPCLLLLHCNRGYIYSPRNPLRTWIHWCTKQWRQRSKSLNCEGWGTMDMWSLRSSTAKKAPLLAMPVLVPQKLVKEAVTYLPSVVWPKQKTLHFLPASCCLVYNSSAFSPESSFKPSTTVPLYFRSHSPEAIPQVGRCKVSG